MNILLIFCIALLFFIHKSEFRYALHKSLTKEKNFKKGNLNQFFSEFKKIPWFYCKNRFGFGLYFYKLKNNHYFENSFHASLVVFDDIVYKYNYFEYTIIYLYIMYFVRNENIPERYRFDSFRELLDKSIY